MKKIVILTLAVMLLLSLCACKKDKNDNTPMTSPDVSVTPDNQQTSPDIKDDNELIEPNDGVIEPNDKNEPIMPTPDLVPDADNNTSTEPEPIEWIVIDAENGKYTLISKYILDARKITHFYSLSCIPIHKCRGFRTVIF